MKEMNNFKKASIISFFLSLPVVFGANITDSLQEPMSMILNLLSLSWIVKSEYVSATKAAIFLILFAVIYSALNYGFGKKRKGILETGDSNQTKKISAIISFSIAAISILFIPDTIVETIGQMYSGIVVLLLVGLPAGIILGYTFYLTKSLKGPSKHLIRGIALLITSSLISTLYEEYSFTSFNQSLFGFATSITTLIGIIELFRALGNYYESRRSNSNPGNISSEEIEPQNRGNEDLEETDESNDNDREERNEFENIKKQLELLLERIIQYNRNTNDLKKWLSLGLRIYHRIAQVSQLIKNDNINQFNLESQYTDLVKDINSALKEFSLKLVQFVDNEDLENKNEIKRLFSQLINYFNQENFTYIQKILIIWPRFYLDVYKKIENKNNSNTIPDFANKYIRFGD